MTDRFDRFTERVRSVLEQANEEASSFAHRYLGTEHILLALIQETDGPAFEVFKEFGIDPERIRKNVELILGARDKNPPDKIELTPRSKKVIELSVDEAKRLNHYWIDTGHLLVGLILEREAIAAGVLETHGMGMVKIEKIREGLARHRTVES